MAKITYTLDEHDATEGALLRQIEELRKEQTSSLAAVTRQLIKRGLDSLTVNEPSKLGG